MDTAEHPEQRRNRLFERDFGDGWLFSRVGVDGSPITVTLPHDAMIFEPRSADASSWAHGAYFSGGSYVYRKTFSVPKEWHDAQLVLRFEGVYRRSRVTVNGRHAGGVSSGYQEFEVELSSHLNPGENVIEVFADNSETPNSRWYTGSGIYRPVTLIARNDLHILPDGVRFRTLSTNPEARVEVTVRTSDVAGAVVEATLRREGKVVATGSGATRGGSAVLQLTVAHPLAWSAEHPHLYDLEVRATHEGEVQDARTERVGIRQFSLDPRRGLSVNARPTLLRGANIHHDNGVLGAATFADAERRRVRILKQNGFNAIRSAHNPASRALIAACDEIGMYVMDELFDGWYDHKTDFDDADTFESAWRDEAAAMVRKDRNSPSVIMYSIGNENGEALAARGRRLAAAMAGELRELDPDRAVTIGVNMVAAAFAGLAGGAKGDDSVDAADGADTAAKAAPDMTSTALNVISNRFGVLMKVLPRIRAADRATERLFESFEVAGYNYGTARYALDARLHPDRIMVGTESMPGDIARNWALVEQLPALIGDFMWAGWDYLGEAGGGSWEYGKRGAPYLKAYPQLLSGTGAIDITGQPGAPVFLAQAAWGLLGAPAIAVRPVPLTGQRVARTSWRSTDAVPSWSWRGFEGHPAEIEIYSSADEVEVLLNDRTLGRKRARANGYLARFRTHYEPGTLVAIDYRRGVETGRSELRSAGEPALRMVAEQASGDARPGGLAFLRVELSDDKGVIDFATDDEVTVTVSGAATLAGFGSAAPATTESFTDAVHTTYRGSALAVLRSTGEPGVVTIDAVSRAHGSASASIEFKSIEFKPIDVRG